MDNTDFSMKVNNEIMKNGMVVNMHEGFSHQLNQHNTASEATLLMMYRIVIIIL